MRWLLGAVVLVAAHVAHAFELSPPAVVGPVGHARYARIASNGEGYLTVWADYRPGLDEKLAVRGMLLDRQGRPRRTRDFRIAAAPQLVREAWDRRPQLQVASNGREYVVAYGDRHSTTFARVTNEGVVEPAWPPAVGNLRSMVAWGRYYAAILESTDRLDLLLVDDRGSIVGGWPIAWQGGRHADLHATADGRLMILVHRGALRVAFVTLDEIFDPQFRDLHIRSEIPFDDGSVAVAELNGRFLIAEATFKNLRLSLIDSDGTWIRIEKRDAPELQESRTLLAAPLGSKDFVLIASSALVREDGFLSVAALQLSADLTPAAAGFRHLSHYAGDDGVSAIVVDGGVTLAHATRNGRCCTEGFDAVRVQRLSASGEHLFGSDGAVASLNFPSQESAVVEQCGSFYVVAWVDMWSDRTQINVRRFLSDGTPIDPPNRAIASALVDPVDLTITCGRSSVLLTWWGELSYIRQLAFIQKRGDGVTHSLHEGGRAAPVFDGEHFVIFGGSFGYPVLTRWNEQGERRGTRAMMGMGSISQTALSWSGQSFHAAWQDESGRLMARRIDRNFDVAGPDIELAARGRGGDFYGELHIASDASGGALAAWGKCNSGLCVAHTSRIDADGVLRDHSGGQSRGDAFPRAVSSISPFLLTLSFNGTAFELLTANGLHTISPDGRSTLRDLTRPAAITSTGDRRMFLSWRLDRDSGMKRLSAAFLDSTAWTLPPSQRQRSARH